MLLGINYAFDLGADDYITQPVKRAEFTDQDKNSLTYCQAC